MKKYKVMIVDDSPSDRRIYRRFLEGMKGIDLEIVEANTGKLALGICPEFKPDCMILDFRLPDSNGLALLPELQKNCPCPVIFITGQPEALTMTEAYRQGVIRYLSKDFLTSEQLREAVRDALNGVN